MDGEQNGATQAQQDAQQQEDGRQTAQQPQQETQQATGEGAGGGDGADNAHDMAAFGRFLEDDKEVKSYLESFGIRGLDDVDELGIKGPYRRDFERLYLGGPLD